MICHFFSLALLAGFAESLGEERAFSRGVLALGFSFSDLIALFQNGVIWLFREFPS